MLKFVGEVEVNTMAWDAMGAELVHESQCYWGAVPNFRNFSGTVCSEEESGVVGRNCCVVVDTVHDCVRLQALLSKTVKLLMVAQRF